MADMTAVADMLLTSTGFVLLTTVVILAGEIWLFLNISELSKKLDEIEYSLVKKKKKR